MPTSRLPASRPPTAFPSRWANGEPALEQTIRQQQNRYWGKYRAFVADNADPEKLGRCRLTIPSVLGEEPSDWALPCLPYGGMADIGMVAVPPIDSQVFAEFVEGDISAPIWTGTFWQQEVAPPAAFTANNAPTAKVVRTESGHTLIFEDKSGEEAVTLTSAAGAVVELNPGGSIALTDSNGATVVIDTAAGEIRIEDADGNSLTMASGGITAKDASGNEIATGPSGIDVKGAMITIEGQSVALGGAGGEPLIKGQSFMAIFNAHTHVCSVPGSPSGPPLPPMTPAQTTIKTTAS